MTQEMNFADLDDNPGPKLRRFPGSHLSAPLTYFPQRLVLKHYDDDTEGPVEAIRAGVRFLKSLTKRWRPCFFTEDPAQVYAKLFSACTRSCDPRENNAAEDVKELNGILLSCCNDFTRSLISIRDHHPAFKALVFHIAPQDINEVILNTLGAYRCYKFTTDVRATSQRAESLGKKNSMYGVFSFNGLEVMVQGQYIACKYRDAPARVALLNYDQWVMICDTVISRFITLVSCELNAKRPYDILPRPSFLRELYKWGDDMIREEGVVAYSVLGEFESIVTACFVSFPNSDPLGLGVEFVKATVQTAQETEDEHKISKVWTERLFELLRRQSSVNVLSETFGLRKHWGNPMVEAAASGRAVQDKLKEDLPIDGVALLELSAALNRMITLAFIKRHHRWPECSFSDKPDGLPYPLKTARERNDIKIPENDLCHDHMDWSYLEFKCNAVVDSYEDQLELLSDKSVSLPVSELDNVYFYSKDKTRERKESGERRLILKYLKEDQLSVKEIFEKIMTWDVPEDWFANSAAMKGTEVKYLKARVFAVLTFEIRQYFAVTEDMIKKHVFPYNPHQTMTMNENELMTKLRGMTKQMDVDSVSRTLNVMHIIDFSKWNLRMRFENTYQVFRSVDQFLGCPGLIEKTHLIFEEMTNLVQDPYNPPETCVAETNSDTIWRNHTRGWEGQRQKGWTLLTSALLSDLERITGIHSEICGQGDNQILLTRFPIPEHFKNANQWIQHEPQIVRSLLDDYYTKLELKCVNVGLKIKTAETCRSLYYMNYGKRLFFCGVELSMTLKRMSKAMTESNDAFPLTETRLKTSQGASYAAGLYSHPSPWPFIMSRFCTTLTLWESFMHNPLIGSEGETMLRKENIKPSSAFFSILNKMPQCLGGPSQQPHAAFFCRGHPDPLCEELVMLCMQARSGCKYSRAIIHCARQGKWFGKIEEVDRSSLILAPYSLNLNIPTSAKSPISKAVLPELANFCQNTSVSGLLSLEVTDHEEKVLKTLSTLTPFNPLIANDIYSRTIVGKRESFVNGLKNATSICRLVQPSSTNPHSLETFKLFKADTDFCSSHENCVQDEHILFVRHNDKLFSPPGVDGSKTQTTRSRTGNPYLGSVISEGIINQQVICKNPSRAFNDACRLNVMRHWVTKEGTALNEILINMIKSRTDVPIELIDKVTGIPGRVSYTHRAPLKETKKSCAITATSNMYTRIYTSSNRMGKYSTSDINYHLPYGPAYLAFSTLLCLEEVLMSQESGHTTEPLQIYHCHMNIEDLPEVFDGELEVGEDQDKCEYPTIPPFLMHTSMDSLVFESLTVKEDAVYFEDYQRAPLRHCRIAYANVLIGDIFVKEIVKKELISCSLVDMYYGKEMVISIGDIRMTNVVGLIKAFAQNMCLVIGQHRAKITDKACFVHAVLDFMKGFSSGFWSSFSNAMGRTDLIETLYTMTDGCGHEYDGADQQTLRSAWQMAVALEMFNIMEKLRKMRHTRYFPPIMLIVPNLSAARHLYSKYVELCIWVIGGQMGADDESLRLTGRDVSRAIHSQGSFAGCVQAVREALMSGKLDSLDLLGTERVFLPRVYNVNDPWIDRLRDSSFDSKKLVLKPKTYKVKPDYSKFKDVQFNISTEELIVVRENCSCHVEGNPAFYRMDGFYCRSGPLDITPYIIRDSLNRYNLSYQKVVMLNDKTGSKGRSLANDSACESIYVVPCRDITDFSPHTAGSFVPPELLTCYNRDKITFPSSAAVIGNVFSSLKSQAILTRQLAKNEWKGIIFCLDEMLAVKDPDSFEDVMNTCLSIASKVSSIEWFMVAGDMMCRHKVCRAVTRIASLFEVIHFNKSPFALQGCSGSIVGIRKRNAITLIPRRSEFIRVESDHDLHMAVRRGNAFEMPFLSKLPHQVQDVWVSATCNEFDLNLSKACDSYLPGFGADKLSFSFNTESMKDELLNMADYHKENMTEIIKTTDKMSRGFRVQRSILLNLSSNWLENTPEYQLCCRARCLILYELLNTLPGSFLEAATRVQDAVQKTYSVSVGRVEYVGSISEDHFITTYSFSLFCILGHVIKTLPYGEPISRCSTSHLERGVLSSQPQTVLPNNLSLIESTETTEDHTYNHESKAKLLSLLMARMLLTKSISPSKDLYRIAHIMEQSGFLNFEGNEAKPNVWWVTDHDKSQHIIHQIKASATENEPVVVIAHRSSFIQLIETFVCDTIYRVPWTGRKPDVFLGRFFEARKTKKSLKRYRVDFESTVDTSYHRIEEHECKCYDCATEEQLLARFNIPKSAFNILHDCRVMESLQDVRDQLDL